ncbi:MAG TPA: LEA type 2 family protein [Chitinophagaceae bacterium]|nr:LEA type 2 family protein [Chitinophagaceae bacterium]
MIKFFVSIFGYTLLLTSLGCSSPKDLEYQDYKNFKLEKLGFGTSRVSLDLQYYNPNNFGLQLRKTELDIFINNNLLGHSSSDTLINIPRRDTFLIPLKFDTDMKNIIKNAWNSMMGNEVSVKVTGKVKVGKGNVFMSMPVNYEGKHKLSLF